MNLAGFSISRPITAGIISVALFFLGIFYVGKMNVSMFPEVQFPFVAITVPYPGGSPEQIEAKIIKPLEAELAGMKKINRLIAIARPSLGQVVVGFKMDASIQESMDAVREKVSIAKRDFPEGTKEPIIVRTDVGAVPVLIYGVESSLAPDVTKKMLDDGLVRTLRRVDGVGEVEAMGLGDRRVELSLDADKLNQLRIAPLEVYGQLKGKMSLIPWGEANKDGTLIQVGRSVLTEDLKHWENQVVTLGDGRGVRLGEIGQLREIRDPDATTVFVNGKKSIGLVITKRADANTVKVVDQVEKTLGKEKMDNGIKLFRIVDQSQAVRENAHEVWIALFVGGAFAILVILLFLTDVKSALISATALPVSVAGSFIFMYALGFTLNMMSLLALSLAIGLLIDDAVVVRESIYSEMEQGKNGKEAALSGTNKVFSAVLATSLAVIAVFVPVSMMEGMVGQFFKEFGMTIVVSVIISTWVAFTLDPMLSAYFAGHPKPLSGVFWDNWRKFLSWLDRIVANGAAFSYRHPILVILSAIVILFGSIALSLSRGADFLAFEDRGQFIVNIRGKPGMPHDELEKVAVEAQKRLEGLEGLQNSFAAVGDRDPNVATIRVVFNSKTERKSGLLTIMEEARARLKGLPAEWLMMDPPPIEGVGQEAPVTVFVYGEDLVKMRPVAEELKAKIQALKGISTARIETTGFSETRELNINDTELGFAGTNSNNLELTGRLALTGLEAGNVGNDNVPFFLRLQESDRKIESLLDKVLIPSLRGPLPMSRFLTLEKSEKPAKIDREKRSRKIIIWASLDRAAPLDQILKQIEVFNSEVPAPFFAETGGDKELFEEMNRNFGIAIIGSLFFIFIILAAQFENLMRPFIIILSLPLAVIGGFLGLYLAGLKFALGAMIGMILLIGLAAKNGILLVDAIGVKEKTMSLAEAVKFSVGERARPIIMTSMAMIFGMLPTALLKGGGSEFRAPMAIAIIGGVISSTLLSFQVIPAVFGLIGGWRRLRGKKDLYELEPTDSPEAHSTHAKARAIGVGGIVLAALAGSLWLPAPKAWAQEPAQANMDALYKAIFQIPSDSSAHYNTQAAMEAARLAKRASREALAGQLTLSAQKTWFSPGYTSEMTLPLPPQLGGPQTFSQTIIPKSQEEYQATWGIPLLNLQALYGIKLANAIQDQAPLVKQLQEEQYTLANAQLVLKYELSVQTLAVQSKTLSIAEDNLKQIQARRIAGTATRADELVALSKVQQYRAEMANTRQSIEGYKVEFHTLTNTDLPENGFGVPQFPWHGDKPLKSVALELLTNAIDVQQQSVDLTDMGFLPTLSGVLGYNKKSYSGAPPAQKFMGLRVEWNLLDSGARSRDMAKGEKELLELWAQKRSTETDLESRHHSLNSRKKQLEEALDAAFTSQKSAVEAWEQSNTAFKAGLVKSTDVRSVEEQRLKADLFVLQIRFALQGLALESMALTGEWGRLLTSR